MNTKFMVDIETTGTDPKQDDILQVAFLQMTQSYPGAPWEKGKALCFTQFSNKRPTTFFAANFLKPLYEKANKTQPIHHTDARRMINNFFKSCEKSGAQEVFLCGWNAANFDIPFLVENRYLLPASYRANADGTETLQGDFHYRIYEMSGALRFAEDLTGLDKKDLDTMMDIELPEPPKKGREHDALFDCLVQVDKLNALNAVVKKVLEAKWRATQ